MTIDKLMNQPVSIVTRAYTGQLDDYGNEIATETTTEVLGYLQQLTGTEREGYVPEASHLLVVPSTTAIQANDNVLVRQRRVPGARPARRHLQPAPGAAPPHRGGAPPHRQPPGGRRMSTTTILDMERISGDYLRANADVTTLQARVAGQLPKTFTKPWVRVTMIDATNVTGNQRVEHLVSYLLQFDAYAGAETDNAQAQAVALARTVRSALIDMQDQTLEGAVITAVEVRNHARLPDLDFDPPRERHVLTVEIWAHPV